MWTTNTQTCVDILHREDSGSPVDRWFFSGLVGMPISCICKHIDAAPRVALAVARHASLAWHMRCVTASARFVFELIGGPLGR